MNARELIQSIQHRGGRVEVHGSDLLLSAPEPLPPSLIAEIRKRKGELLDALHLDEFIKEFQRAGRIRIESDWAGAVWLVASTNHVRGNEDGSVYFPNEVPTLIPLSTKERRLLHEFKRQFKATIELKPEDEDQ